MRAMNFAIDPLAIDLMEWPNAKTETINQKDVASLCQPQNPRTSRKEERREEEKTKANGERKRKRRTEERD